MRGLVLCLLAGATSLAPARPDPPRAASTLREAEDAQAQLVTIRRGDAVTLARGSAFFIDAYGRLLTCAHVLDHMPREETPRLRLRDGRERRFSVLKVDREVDLAVLLSDPPAYFLALDERPMPDIGQSVLLGGFAARPAEEGPAVLRLRSARVAAFEHRWATGARRTVGSRRRIVSVKVDQVADPGQSGGPLLAEGTLAVVGILRSNLEKATGGLGGVPSGGYGAAIPMVYVKPLLAALE